MATNSTWRGAIEFKVNGFPVPVNLRLYPRVSGMKGEGFSLLSPNGKTVKQKYLEDGGKWKGTIGECARGVKVGPDDIRPIDKTTLEAIAESERSHLVEPDSFAPVDSIDLAVAKAAYYVQPEDETAARSAQVIWNGLLVNRLAYVTRVVLRAGGIDQIIAIYADRHGLKAVALPFAQEVNYEPECEWTPDQAVADMFMSAVEASYEVRDFDPADHPSQHVLRRQELLAKFLAGEKIEAPQEPAQAPQAPDLMSLLTAEAPKPKPRRKSTAKAKVTA